MRIILSRRVEAVLAEHFAFGVARHDPAEGMRRVGVMDETARKLTMRELSRDR
jgi:hypothetical protein